MRLIVQDYAKGGRWAYETSDDGGTLVRDIEGTRQPYERTRAFIEVGCDTSDQGIDRLLNSLAWLTEELKKRKGNGTSP
jgi:hypothetical protein